MRLFMVSDPMLLIFPDTPLVLAYAGIAGSTVTWSAAKPGFTDSVKTITKRLAMILPPRSPFLHIVNTSLRVLIWEALKPTIVKNMLRKH